MLLYSSYDNTLSICSTKHMQVYFVLRKELLQAGILELRRYSLLSLIHSWYPSQECIAEDIDKRKVRYSVSIFLSWCMIPAFSIGYS